MEVLSQAISPFPTVFSTHLENFPLFPSNLICLQTLSVWTSLKIVIWEKVNRLPKDNDTMGISGEVFKEIRQPIALLFVFFAESLKINL